MTSSARVRRLTLLLEKKHIEKQFDWPTAIPIPEQMLNIFQNSAPGSRMLRIKRNIDVISYASLPIFTR